MKRFIFILLGVLFIRFATYARIPNGCSGTYQESDRNKSYATPLYRDYKPNYNKAAKTAKNLFIAVANGDVAMLKRITTANFYYSNFPYGDERTKTDLLKMPYHRRAKLVDHIRNHASIDIVPTSERNIVTIIFTNTISKKEFYVILIDDNENNEWKVFDSTYQFR